MKGEKRVSIGQVKVASTAQGLIGHRLGIEGGHLVYMYVGSQV